MRVEEALFSGNGEIAAQMRSLDWSKTPLGAVTTWAFGLKTAFSILLSSCCPMFLVWGRDRILLYNDAYFRLLEESNCFAPIGQPISNGWLEAWSHVWGDIEQVFVTGQPIQREHKLSLAPQNGATQSQDYTWSCSAIWDEADQISGVIATGRRATARAIVLENGLQQQNEELQLLINTVPTLIAYVDKNHRYRFVNQAYESWFGQPVGTVVGKHVREVLGKSVYEAILPYMEKVLAGQQVTFESQIPYHDGRVRYVMANYIPHVNFQGVIEGYVGLVSDISARKLAEDERKQAEAALRLSEERSRLATTVAQLGTWCYDPDTNLIELDKRMRQIWGMSDQIETISLSAAMERIHPDDRNQVVTAVNAALDPTSSGIYAIDYRIAWDNGTERWLAVNGQVQFAGEGASRHPINFIGTALDITDRKQAEQAVWNSAERLSLALTAAKLGDWSWDADTDMVTFSERAAAIFGIPPGSYLTWTQMRNLLHPEDRERARLQVEQAIAQRSDYDIEYRVTHPDTGERWVAVKGRAQYAPSGQVLGMLGVLQDVTGRKQAEAALQQSEERYRYLVESIPQLVWTANAEGVLLDVNQRWLEFTGLSLAQVQIEGWEAVVHPNDIPVLSQQWAVAQHNSTYYQAEGRMRRADGGYRWHLHQAIPQKNDQGQVVKWFGTATDIEDKKQLEQQRDRLLQQEQAAREAAETANRIKDEFLAVLSHELRSPLNPILGWAKLLQTGRLAPQKAHYALETIERNAKLQAQLIEDLLDVSRILRGKLVLNTATVDLVSTIEAALETVRLAADAKGIQIHTALDPNAGTVLGDPARLQQIVWNLLSNAVKFTSAGGAIDIRLEQVNQQVQLQVQDTGKGINLEFLPYIFEYFRQEDGTTTRKFGGLGLGLAIVRHLVELHGGTVWAESAGEGQGATFIVSLPLMSATTTTPQENLPTDPLASLAGLQILVVDDEPDVRNIVEFILEEVGATVRVADSAPTALDLIEQSLPDVLICDIGMPDMDGYMLIRQLRAQSAQQGGQIPAIALSAYAGEYDQQQALAAGFQRHIAKPVEPEALVRAIASLLAESSLTSNPLTSNLLASHPLDHYTHPSPGQ
ncbi:MAG: hypothetical protein Kow00121_33690 [Elainellaceae cyanobacterium]